MNNALCSQIQRGSRSHPVANAIESKSIATALPASESFGPIGEKLSLFLVNLLKFFHFHSQNFKFHFSRPSTHFLVTGWEAKAGSPVLALRLVTA